MRKDKESGNFMVFKCVLPSFNTGFEHLYGLEFPLAQYASLVFLFALVKKKYNGQEEWDE